MRKKSNLNQMDVPIMEPVIISDENQVVRYRFRHPFEKGVLLHLEDYINVMRDSGDIRFQPPTSEERQEYEDRLKNPYYGPYSSMYRSTQLDSRTAASANYSGVIYSIWIMAIAVFFVMTLIFCVLSCVFYEKIKNWSEHGKCVKKLNIYKSK